MGEERIKINKEDSSETKKKEITKLMGKKRQRLENIVKRKKIGDKIQEKKEKIKNLKSEIEMIESEVQTLYSEELKLKTEENIKIHELNDEISFQQSNYLSEIDEEDKLNEILGNDK